GSVLHRTVLYCPPQLVWLVIAFIALMILTSRLAMPRIAHVLEQRETRIRGDLDRAERVKIEADEALSAYQKAMSNARAKAQGDLRQTQAEIAAETAKREAAFAQQLAQRTKAAEDSIAQVKTRALAELRGVGIEVAGGGVKKVARGELPPGGGQGAAAAAPSEGWAREGVHGAEHWGTRVLIIFL